MSYKKRNTTHIKRNITSKKSKKEKTNIIPFKTKKESPPKPLLEILIKKTRKHNSDHIIYDPDENF